MQTSFVKLAYVYQVTDHLLDFSVSLNGVLTEYYTYMLMEQLPLDVDRVVDLLVDLADAMAAGFAQSSIPPVITRDMLPDATHFIDRLAEVSLSKVESALDSIGDESARLPAAARKEVLQTLTLMREELATRQPRKLVLQALLANLRDFRSLLPFRQSLAAEWQVKLL